MYSWQYRYSHKKKRMVVRNAERGPTTMKTTAQGLLGCLCVHVDLPMMLAHLGDAVWHVVGRWYGGFCDILVHSWRFAFRRTFPVTCYTPTFLPKTVDCRSSTFCAHQTFVQFTRERKIPNAVVGLWATYHQQVLHTVWVNSLWVYSPSTGWPNSLPHSPNEPEPCPWVVIPPPGDHRWRSEKQTQKRQIRNSQTLLYPEHTLLYL